MARKLAEYFLLAFIFAGRISGLFPAQDPFRTKIAYKFKSRAIIFSFILMLYNVVIGVTCVWVNPAMRTLSPLSTFLEHFGIGIGLYLLDFVHRVLSIIWCSDISDILNFIREYKLDCGLFLKLSFLVSIFETSILILGTYVYYDQLFFVSSTGLDFLDKYAFLNFLTADILNFLSSYFIFSFTLHAGIQLTAILEQNVNELKIMMTGRNYSLQVESGETCNQCGYTMRNPDILFQKRSMFKEQWAKQKVDKLFKLKTIWEKFNRIGGSFAGLEIFSSSYYIITSVFGLTGSEIVGDVLFDVFFMLMHLAKIFSLTYMGTLMESTVLY